jgi:isoleucyl-tRNA synthetase
VRRSRRRFWKTEDDADKQQAYQTLHYVILRTCQLLAPFSPFLPDYIWRQMVQGTDFPESVHLSDWPSVEEPDTASQKLLETMKQARAFIVEGLAQRAAAGVKVRQPLQSVEVPELSAELMGVIADELNVKAVKVGAKVQLNTQITSELKTEGLARELVRVIQNARKNAGFNVEDRIKTSVTSESSEITSALNEFKEIIDAETLTLGELNENDSAEHAETVKVEGQEVTIKLSRNG